ncbi:S41 family peptidase [Planctomycetaceae bacterium SH139]
MPPRNLYAIIVIAIFSLLCHAKAQRTRDGALVGDAIALIDFFYVDEVPKRNLLEAAMSGLTSELDPYTQFIPPSAYDAFQDSIQQEFAGIGILIEQPVAGEPVRVITPLVGSPAIKAGFRPRDQIVAVNDIDTAAATMDQVRDLLRGPVGSSARVLVRRADRQIQRATDSAEREAAEPTPEPEAVKLDETEYEELELVVQRANIQLESVIGDHRDADNHWVFRLADDPDIAYVRLTGFGERTTRELKQALLELDGQFEGLILDLRGNSGGLLISAVEVCDLFIERGRIVSTRGRGILNDDEKEAASITESAYNATAGVTISPRIPMAVLIDGDSASASEIVAACLKDHNRAKVIGERSFGKGSVQNVFALESGRSALKLTTARYYRPNGQNIHRGKDDPPEAAWGVKPSPGFEVILDDTARRRAIRRWELATYPSMAATLTEEQTDGGPLEDVDPQLFRAMDWLQEVTNKGAEDATKEIKDEEMPEQTAA